MLCPNQTPAREPYAPSVSIQMARLEGLPDELKLYIISFLKTETTASQKASRAAAPPASAEELHPPLKSVSLLSHDWRRIVSPLVFSHLQIKLTARSVDMVQRDLTRFLDFVEPKGLAAKVGSVVVSTKEAINPHSYKEDIFDFWKLLMNACDPKRISIVAPPITLACLTCSGTIYRTDEWAFPETALQALSLSDPYPPGPRERSNSPKDGIFWLRYWRHTELSDGSFLQAYATYEYFHKQPPSILQSAFLDQFDLSNAHETTKSYHAVFPFKSYFDRFPSPTWQCGRLCVTLAPSPDDKRLDDPDYIGKVDLSDCWREIEQIYFRLTNPMGPVFWCYNPYLRHFTSGDIGYEFVRELLDRQFEQLKPLGWEKTGEGTWSITETGKELRRCEWLGQNPDQELPPQYTARAT